MELKLIYYTFPRRNYSILNRHLDEFKNELSKNINYFSNLKIINGEEKFRDTYHFMDHLIKPMILSSEINFSHLQSILWKVSENKIQTIKDKFPQAYRFFEDNKNIDINEISQSLTIKTIICVGKNGLKFKDDAGAHGLSEPNGRYTVVIKSYKNIVWHEVAHLFGADEHYIENNVYKMKEKCTDKKLCIMQYDPGYKPCSFCSTALQEIGDNMFKETMPRFINEFFKREGITRQSQRPV